MPLVKSLIYIKENIENSLCLKVEALESGSIDTYDMFYKLNILLIKESGFSKNNDIIPRNNFNTEGTLLIYLIN